MIRIQVPYDFMYLFNHILACYSALICEVNIFNIVMYLTVSGCKREKNCTACIS